MRLKEVKGVFHSVSRLKTFDLLVKVLDMINLTGLERLYAYMNPTLTIIFPTKYSVSEVVFFPFYVTNLKFCVSCIGYSQLCLNFCNMNLVLLR